MSLRLRAVFITGLALLVLWALVATWIMRGIQTHLYETLDQRLAMSARMVSGLMQRSVFSADAIQSEWRESVKVEGEDSIACQIKSLHGEVLAETEGGPHSMFGTLPLGYSTRDAGGSVWRIYTLQHDNYLITTADRIEERSSLLRDILLAAGLPFLVAMFGGLIALWIGIGRGLLPLDVLRYTLSQRHENDTNPIADKGTPAELKPFIASLNDLLGRLSQALAHQRAFTDAAAHELRTPLTAIDMHLQLVRLTPGDDADIALGRAEEGVKRLRRTLDQMMSLARAESSDVSEIGCDSVQSLLESLLSRFPDIDRARIDLEFIGDDFSLPASVSMLETSLRNLLENALRYSPSESRVDLIVRKDENARECVICVCDRGTGLSNDQIERAGQRFWRGDQGRTGTEGSGLGISIVRAIASRCSGALLLTKGEEGGLVAELRFPLLPAPWGQKT